MMSRVLALSFLRAVEILMVQLLGPRAFFAVG